MLRETKAGISLARAPDSIFKRKGRIFPLGNLYHRVCFSAVLLLITIILVMEWFQSALVDIRADGSTS